MQPTPSNERRSGRALGAMRALFSLVFAASFAATGCQSGASPGRVPPAAEFLFAAGDSTYWVRSGAEGIRVRSAPILLTQVDGKFYEVFIAEDGAEYEDASFASSRLWSRELTSTDSLMLFDDSTVMREAAIWKKRHPRALPINIDDEDIPADPSTIVHEEIEIVDVHGPWLTFRQVLDIDIDGGTQHRHVGRRAVVDVRTGALATLRTLFGDTVARNVTVAGRASLAQLVDSIRSVGDERAEMARETLDSFRFDSTSFGVSDIDRAPAVAFLIPGASADGEALAIYLPPIAVAAPSWWESVRATLPEWTADSSRVRWIRPGYEVAATPSADGESLALVLTSGARLSTGEWPIATVAAPAYQLIALDSPTVTAEFREALARAFDASAALDGLVQRASLHLGAWPPIFRRPLRQMRTRPCASRTSVATSLRSLPSHSACRSRAPWWGGRSMI